MSFFVLPIVGIVIGIVATIIVTRYYFQRSIDKRLTPYIHSVSRVLGGIHESVRPDLKVLYRGEEVTDLTELQFIIANDGQRSIRDWIEPLSVTLPNHTKVLDATILHKHPSELAVTTKISSEEGNAQKVTLEFPLLNRGDFFLLKLLIKGDLNPQQLAFRILVDDLPPSIKPVYMPITTSSQPPSRVDWPPIVVGLFLISIGIASGYGMFSLWSVKPHLFPYPWSSYNFTVLNALIFLGWFFGLVLFLVFGLLLCFGIGLDLVFKKQRTFPLPEKYRSDEHILLAPGMRPIRITASELAELEEITKLKNGSKSSKTEIKRRDHE